MPVDVRSRGSVSMSFSPVHFCGCARPRVNIDVDGLDTRGECLVSNLPNHYSSFSLSLKTCLKGTFAILENEDRLQTLEKENSAPIF